MKQFTILLLLLLLAGCAGMKKANDFYEQKNYQAAIEECLRAIEKDSSNAEAYFILGKSYVALNKFDEALINLQKAFRIEPKSAVTARAKKEIIKTRLFKADEAKKEKNYNIAFSEYKEVLALDSTNFQANYNLAGTYEENHWLEKARFYFEQASKLQPDNISIKHKILSIDSLTQLAEKHFEKGKTYYRQSKNISASSSLKRALTIKDDFRDANYYYYMAQGKILFQKGTKSKLWDAIEQFGKAMMLNEEAAEPHFYLAKAYEKKDRNEFDNAIEEYKIALNKEPDGPLAKQSKNKIKELTAKRDKMKSFWGK